MEVVAKENEVTIIDHESGNLIEKNVDDRIMVPKKSQRAGNPISLINFQMHFVVRVL